MLIKRVSRRRLISVLSSFSTTWHQCLVALASVVGACLLLIGCAQEAGDTETLVEPTTDEITITAIMDPMLDSASEVFWDSAGFIDTYEGTIDLTPTTDEGWQAIIDAADKIDELSALLQEERYSLNRPAWNALSGTLVDAAARGRQAAQNRDGEELFQAGAQLYQVCVACHQTFWSNNRFTTE